MIDKKLIKKQKVKVGVGGNKKIIWSGMDFKAIEQKGFVKQG